MRSIVFIGNVEESVPEVKVVFSTQGVVVGIEERSLTAKKRLRRGAWCNLSQGLSSDLPLKGSKEEAITTRVSAEI